MFDAETTAILTGAAGNIVAYMLSGRVDALRTWVVRIFRDGPDQLHAIEGDTAALASHTLSVADAKARWAAMLAYYLAEHPEARAEIQAISAAPAVIRSMSVQQQHNHGSGTFVGGDNYGQINAAAAEE